TFHAMFGSRLAAARRASTHDRIAAVPETPPQDDPVPSTPSEVLLDHSPQSIERKSVFPKVNAYVRSFPGRFTNAQWMSSAVCHICVLGCSWFPRAGSTKELWPNACHFWKICLTIVSFGESNRSPRGRTMLGSTALIAFDVSAVAWEFP